MAQTIDQKIGYWELRRKVTNLFDKWGHFYAGTPEFYKFQKKLRELGLTIHEAGKYRYGKKRK